MDNGGIFINYRRCDGSGSPRGHALFVEILSQELADHFGDGNGFVNNSTNPGDGYPDELRAKLASCDVLLVVIHPEWLDDLGERRDGLTDDEVDQVHYEISAALNGTLHSRDSPARHPKVIPILLEKTDPPKSAELPEDIRELALLQAFRLRFGSLTTDLTRLLTELELHTITRWPPAPEPEPQSNLRGVFGRAAPGQAASRGLVATAFATGFLSLLPEDKSALPSTTFLLVWSTWTVILTLLGAVATTIFGRSLYRMEYYVHSLPAAWLLIVRLVFAAIVIILLARLVAGIAPYFSFVTGWVGGIILLFCVFSGTIRDIQEDSEWPPSVIARPMALRRAIVRLEYRLTSLWHPPLSRIQREQAWSIIHQLDSALVALRRTANCTHTRRIWLRTGCPRLAVGYAVWLVGTLGLAVASMYRGSAMGGSLDWSSIAAGVVACGLGIGTMELMFRNDRKVWCWFIEEIKKNREEQLLRHLHIGEGGHDGRTG